MRSGRRPLPRCSARRAGTPRRETSTASPRSSSCPPRAGSWISAAGRAAARFLAEAGRRAAEATLDVEWVEADMREFVRPGAFDAAINMFTSFGIFEDPADDVRVARNLFECVRQGGSVVLELMGKENLARVFSPRDWVENEDGEIWLYERRVEDSWSWIENRWILIRNGERREFRVSHRLYSAKELADLFRNVGFASVETFGSLDRAPYDQTAPRLILLARKQRSPGGATR